MEEGKHVAEPRDEHKAKNEHVIPLSYYLQERCSTSRNQTFDYNILLRLCKGLGPKADPRANKNRDVLDNIPDDAWVHRRLP